MGLVNFCGVGLGGQGGQEGQVFECFGGLGVIFIEVGWVIFWWRWRVIGILYQLEMGKIGDFWVI
jgi:hypothetical protein